MEQYSRYATKNIFLIPNFIIKIWNIQFNFKQVKYQPFVLPTHIIYMTKRMIQNMVFKVVN